MTNRVWRRALILGAVLVVPGPREANAQMNDRWRVLATTRSGLIAFDTATVDRKGSRVFEAWLRFDGDPEDSMRNASFRQVHVSQKLVRYGLDCVRRQIAPRNSTYYDSAGTVITSSTTDSLRWQLVLPESRGESFWQAFCDVVEGRDAHHVWLVPSIAREAFSPRGMRMEEGTELRISAGVDTVHEFAFDTVGLSPSQKTWVAKYTESGGLPLAAYGLGDYVIFSRPPAGRYKLYCVSHMPYRSSWLDLEVVRRAGRSSTQRPTHRARP